MLGSPLSRFVKAQSHHPASTLSSGPQLPQPDYAQYQASNWHRETYRADLVVLHHGMRDTPYQAKLAISLLSKMFSEAPI